MTVVAVMVTVVAVVAVVAAEYLELNRPGRGQATGSAAQSRKLLVVSSPLVCAPEEVALSSQ